MTVKKLKKLIFAALCSTSIWAAAASAGVNGTVRGVTFYYLDGSANIYATPPTSGQGFEWVLDNQYDPTVRARLDNLLATYRDAGVNWIRLLVASNNFAATDMEPVPSAAWIKKLNDFLAITNAGANQGQFHIEIVLVPKRANNMTEAAPFTHDKLWLKTWLDGINYTNVGQIMLGGDLSPCLLGVGCQGDAGATGVVVNHGNWIKGIWAWKQSTYPTLNASYEVIGIEDGSSNNPALIASLAHWSDTNTPTNPTLSAAIYITLAPGATWQQYATATLAVLDSYAAASPKNLHIDEYGKSRGTDTSGNNWTLADQRAAYQGFLGAIICDRQRDYSKFAWVASRDYPYDIGPANRARWNGLVDSFTLSNMPVMSATWGDLKQYYTLQTCP